MRCIDADALLTDLNNIKYPGAPYVDAGIRIAVGKICDAKTIEPERKKGKWETVEDWDGNEHYRCFKCGAEFVLIDGTHVHMNYGDFLRRARLDAGLTQTELAKRMGVTPQYISQYERNNRMPKTETVVKFAKALGTPENNDYYFCPHCGTRMTEEDV